MATKPMMQEVAVSPVTMTMRSKRPSRLAFERFMHNRLAVGGVVVLFLIILLVTCAPLVAHWSPTQIDLMNSDSPPSAAHLLGTNTAGIDYWSLDVYGGRVDFLVGFLCTAGVLSIGITLGGLAGYFGGWVDAVVMRVCDFMFNFPFLLLVIVITAVFDAQSVWLLIFAIIVTGWAGTTRFVRGMFLNLRESEYVLAAQMSGAGAWRIIFKHMLPNAIGPLVVLGSLTLSAMISVEAGLSLIGFGPPPSTPSWGNVLSSAMDFLTLQTEPWAWIPPAVLLSLSVLSVNFIGDGLRDALDPTSQSM